MSGLWPQDRPCFPPYFVEQCRLTLRQRTCSQAQHQRAQLVVLLHHSPTLSNPAAGAAVGLHPNSVRLWRRRWAEGDFSLDDRPGRGCKPSCSPGGAGSGQSRRLRRRA
jgi:hypothetical protein